MKIVKALIITGIIISIITVLVIQSTDIFTKRDDSSVAGTTAVRTPVHSLEYFDDNLFNQSLNIIKEKDLKDFGYSISGAIIPHHDLAGELIAELFNALQKQKVDTIILIGPNHYNTGNNRVITSDYNWETPEGIVESNSTIINNFTKSGIVAIDYETLQKEHSIYTITPYIKHYLPQTQIIPIIIRKQFDLTDVENLANLVSKFTDENTVVLTSTDFSHYLPIEEAEQKDQETIKIISDFNLESLILLDNDNIDSENATAVLLSVMKNKGTDKIEIIDHRNSGNIGGDEKSTTSYYLIHFY